MRPPRWVVDEEGGDGEQGQVEDGEAPLPARSSHSAATPQAGQTTASDAPSIGSERPSSIAAAYTAANIVDDTAWHPVVNPSSLRAFRA